MTLELPALHGGDPLGYLAALGLLRLLHTEHPGHVRLSFSTSTRCALLHSPLTTIEDVASTLEAIIAKIPEDGALPDLDPRFPLRPKTRSRTTASNNNDESDPMRVPREKFRSHLLNPITALGDEALDWLPFLITDLTADDKGRAALTPYMAPSGKQNTWTFFRKPLEAVRDNPAHLTEALTTWRRIDGFTGEYLDHRVLRGAADHPSGKSTEAGVPGATWLATQALPLLRLTSDGHTPTATLWHRHGRRTIMIWPLWHPALDLHAVTTLIEHPALRPRAPRTNNQPTPPIVLRDPLTPLGVFSLHGAERQRIPNRKNAGALAPITVLDHDPAT